MLSENKTVGVMVPLHRIESAPSRLDEENHDDIATETNELSSSSGRPSTTEETNVSSKPPPPPAAAATTTATTVATTIASIASAVVNGSCSNNSGSNSNDCNNSVGSTGIVDSDATVRTLFGPNVGACWGDFFCTLNRIRGRLYATSTAALFYSNLLGFERRLVLDYRRILQMELYRTTSIRIIMKDFETHVFKSFDDREQVLHVLKGLKLLVDKQNNNSNRNSNNNSSTSSSKNSNISVIRRANQRRTSERAGMDRAAGGGLIRSNSTNVPRPLVAMDASSQLHDLPPPLPSVVPNRRRCVSDSLLRAPQEEAIVVSSPATPTTALRTTPTPTRTSDIPHQNGDDSSFNSTNNVVGNSDATEKAWEDMLRSRTNRFPEKGIEAVTLECSLDEYFRKFLADDAPYSVDRYQREYVKDENVTLGSWQSHDDDAVLTRTIYFSHPIKYSIGIGPTAAQTTRKQRLRRYENYGFTFENITHVQGIPAADSFHVQDHWIIAASAPTAGSDNSKQACVTVTADFDIVFTKRALLRSFIEKSVRKETTDWFAGYVNMLRKALVSESTDDENDDNVRDVRNNRNPGLDEELAADATATSPLFLPTQFDRWWAVIAVILLVLIWFVLVLQLRTMQEILALLTRIEAQQNVTDAQCHVPV